MVKLASVYQPVTDSSEPNGTDTSEVVITSPGAPSLVLITRPDLSKKNTYNFCEKTGYKSTVDVFSTLTGWVISKFAAVASWLVAQPLKMFPSFSGDSGAVNVSPFFTFCEEITLPLAS